MTERDNMGGLDTFDLGYAAAKKEFEAAKESNRKELEEKDRRIAEYQMHFMRMHTLWVACGNEPIDFDTEELTKQLTAARKEGFEEGELKESDRWANRLNWLHTKYDVDGSGCESGDAVDVIESEIKQALDKVEQAGRDEVLTDLDFEPDSHHTVSDMANVGYSLMEAIRIAHPSYMWNDSPAEIVVDLLNEIGDMKTWLPINTAPQDNTLLLLLIEGGDNSTEDSEVWRTIGGNNYDNDGVDKWQFAGWCWSHDHFSEGSGKVIGWLPLIPRPSAPVKGE